MRTVIQRVTRAEVRVKGEVCGQIQRGLLVLIAVHVDDREEDLNWIVDRLAKLRIFEDDDGRMNRSVLESGGGILLVSQFTLYGNVKKGTRPSFNRSAGPSTALPLYERAAELLLEKGVKSVATGLFGEFMEVDLVNDGPVTILLDSRQKDF